MSTECQIGFVLNLAANNVNKRQQLGNPAHTLVRNRSDPRSDYTGSPALRTMNDIVRQLRGSAQLIDFATANSIHFSLWTIAARTGRQRGCWVHEFAMSVADHFTTSANIDTLAGLGEGR